MLPNDLLLHQLQQIFYLVRTNRSSFYIHLFSRTSMVKDGLVYIFLHETRTSEDWFRDRTKTPTPEHPDSDELKLREVFSSRTCKTFRNRTKEEIFKKIKEITQSHDVFVFVFLSYLWCDKNKTEGGNKVRIECRNGCFTLGELFEATKNQPCLVGKSKIFLTPDWRRSIAFARHNTRINTLTRCSEDYTFRYKSAHHLVNTASRSYKTHQSRTTRLARENDIGGKLKPDERHSIWW